MKFRSFLLLTGLASVGLLAHGQALPAATRGGDLQVGLSGSAAKTDLYPGKVVGFTPYATFDLNEHLGAEAEAHIMIVRTPNDFVENSYLIGPRYVFHYGRFNPYAKVLAGIGTTAVVDEKPYTVNTPGTFFAFGFGVGIDYSLPHRINIRIEGERQDWPGFSPHGLTPSIGSIGVAYRFHH